MLRLTILRFYLLLLLLAALSSCMRKTEAIPIGGEVMSINEGQALPGALVQLYTRKIESGIYTANYSFFDSVRTNENGAFQFELPSDSWASIKILFSKEGYFNWDFELEGETLVTNEGINEVFSLDPISWVLYKISNSDPFDSSDRLEFRLMNSNRICENCCSNDLQIFQGKNFSDEWSCQVVGHQDLVYQWGITRNGVRNGGTKTIFVPAGDTVIVNFE